MVIAKTKTFEASHVIPNHPGKCSRLHGHSWEVTVAVSGPVDSETGMVVDYAWLGEVMQRHIIDVCDHQHLGQGDVDLKPQNSWTEARTSVQHAVFGPEFLPTAENLARAFFKILAPFVVEKSANLVLEHVIVKETSGTSSLYDGSA